MDPISNKPTDAAPSLPPLTPSPGTAAGDTSTPTIPMPVPPAPKPDIKPEPVAAASVPTTPVSASPAPTATMPAAPAVTPLVVPPPGAPKPVASPPSVSVPPLSVPTPSTPTTAPTEAKNIPINVASRPTTPPTPNVAPAPVVPPISAAPTPPMTQPGMSGVDVSAPKPAGMVNPMAAPVMPLTPTAPEKKTRGKAPVVILILAILAFLIGGAVMAASLCVGPRIPFLSDRFSCGTTTNTATQTSETQSTNDQGLTGTESKVDNSASSL